MVGVPNNVNYVLQKLWIKGTILSSPPQIFGFFEIWDFQGHYSGERNANESQTGKAMTVKLGQHKVWVAFFLFQCPMKWWRHVRWRHRPIHNESFSGYDTHFICCTEKTMTKWNVSRVFNNSLIILPENRGVSADDIIPLKILEAFELENSPKIRVFFRIF